MTIRRTVRLPEKLDEDLNRIAEAHYHGGYSTALRLAIDRGIAALEREYKIIAEAEGK